MTDVNGVIGAQKILNTYYVMYVGKILLEAYHGLVQFQGDPYTVHITTSGSLFLYQH